MDMDGLYHFVPGGGLTTWYGFANKILEGISGHISHALLMLVPIHTIDYPLPAKWPRNSNMSNEKLKHMFGLAFPSWEQSLKLCIDELTYSAV
jgi:dTDP-4-dehydrorhamnose reductase